MSVLSCFIAVIVIRVASVGVVVPIISVIVEVSVAGIVIVVGVVSGIVFVIANRIAIVIGLFFLWSVSFMSAVLS